MITTVVPGEYADAVHAPHLSGQRTEMGACVTVNGHRSGTPENLELDDGLVSGVMVLDLISGPSVWSAAEEKRFQKLAVAHALRSIGDNDAEEYEVLKAQRRRLHHPRSGQEILAEFQRKKMENELMGAFHRYVRFIQTQSGS